VVAETGIKDLVVAAKMEGAGEIAEETIDPIIGSEDKIFLFHGKSDVLRSHNATEKTSVGPMG